MTRELIKNKFGGKCAYCGTTLGKKWHVDHVKPVYRGGGKDGGMWKPELDRQENKYPACIQCNIFKSVFSIEELRHEIGMQVERARKSSVNFRTAERFGQITVTQTPIVFWFEQYNLPNNSQEPSAKGDL